MNGDKIPAAAPQSISGAVVSIPLLRRPIDLGPPAYRLWQRLPHWSHTFILSSLVGLSVGVVAALLRWMMETLEESVFLRALGMDAGYGAAPLRPWALLLLPTLGGLAAGLLVAMATECAGGGTDLLVAAFHRKALRWRWRALPVKLLASSLAVSLGIAGGGEGPIAYLGALVGQRWAELAQLSPRHQAKYFTAGVAAGVGAFFHAPLGGALFATEVYYRRPDVESGSLLPALLASVGAFTVYNMAHGYHPLLPAPTGFALDLSSTVMLLGVSLACALMSRVALAAIDSTEHRFRRIPLTWRPALAGLLSGALALAALMLVQAYMPGNAHPGLPVASLGEGYEVLRLAASGHFPLWNVLLLMLGVRLVTTALAVGSSSPVGSFAPAMVLGAATGLAAGLVGQWTGLYHGDPVPLALMGMAAFFSASFRCPLAAVVMIAEISNGYGLLPELMIAATVGYLVGPDPGWVRGQKISRLNRGLEA